MTNQASGETIDEVLEGLARYNCNAFTKNTLPNEIPPYVAKERVLSLIRTEKLKLLAEVRGRAIPNPTTPAGENEFVPLEILTKLEAEL